MRHPGEPSKRGSFLGILLLSTSMTACVGGCRRDEASNSGGRSTGGASEDPRPPGGGSAGGAKVGNNDPSGVDNQPNWDAMAAELAKRVQPRMPEALPSDPAVACGEMLDAAKGFYEATERDPLRRAARVADLEATRDDDLKSCVEGTSVAAATCVTILLGDRDSEFPWLLDQCSRAYPRT